MKKETLDYITQIYQSENFIINPTAYFYDMSIAITDETVLCNEGQF